MERERLKSIYKNLRSLCNALEAEIYSDPASYIKSDDSRYKYGEQYDDDGDPD